MSSQTELLVNKETRYFYSQLSWPSSHPSNCQNTDRGIKILTTGNIWHEID